MFSMTSIGRRDYSGYKTHNLISVDTPIRSLDWVRKLDEARYVRIMPYPYDYEVNGG